MMRSLVTAGLLVLPDGLTTQPDISSAALAETTPTGATAVTPARARHSPKFVNPVCEGADPWVIRDASHYYFCETQGSDAIAVRQSSHLSDKGVRRQVWRAAPGRWNSHDIWAPELHKIFGRWYIYYTASDGKDANHRAGVLRARTDDPQGEYEDCGMLYTGDDLAGGAPSRWAIDPTPLQIGKNLYLVWSGWPAAHDEQYLYIARMENPWTVSSDRVRLCDNDTYIWERVNDSAGSRGLHEAPEVLQHGGRVFVVYSCSSSWDPTYKLSMLYMDEGADPLNPRSWTKCARPVLESTREVFGVGHASFTTSPDGTQDWILFHAKRSRTPGWDRAIWAQPFTWGPNGMPDFGTPLPAGQELDAPSGESAQAPGGIFRDAFLDGTWDRWMYYGHERYIWVDDGRLNLGGMRDAGASDYCRTGEKALVRGSEWTNCSLRVRMRIEAGHHEAGLLLRVQDAGLGYNAQKGYFAGLQAGTGKLVFCAFDGSRSDEIAVADHPVAYGKWYTLRVDAAGDLLHVYVNDELMITARDSRFHTGMAGLRVVDTHAEFTDFEISPR